LPILQLNNKTVLGKEIIVNVSKAQTRVFIGSIPKDKTAEQIKEEMERNNGELLFL
jgi:hypothetical protein